MFIACMHRTGIRGAQILNIYYLVHYAIGYCWDTCEDQNPIDDCWCDEACEYELDCCDNYYDSSCSIDPVPGSACLICLMNHVVDYSYS